jgi:ABC-2 type transport system permease protein
MWNRIAALMVKEFLALLKDKRSRFVLILPPIIQTLVFGYAATFDLNYVPYAVYNEDGGVAARDLIARFRGSPHFEEVARIASVSEIAPLVENRRALVVLHIGPRFSREILQGSGGQLQLIVDGRNSNSALIAVSYAGAIVERFNDDWLSDRGLPARPTRLETRAWFNPNMESRWFFVPGIVGLLTLMVTMLVTALSVAREREQGTFDQLLLTPLRPVEILLGKALPGCIVGIVVATVITLVATLWFRIPLLGSLPALYCGLLLFLLSAVGVGLMISSLAVTQQQALLGVFLFMVPAILLSGFATPIENMPPPVQAITLFNPMRYLLIILREVFLAGATFRMLVPQFWPMALIGLVTLPIAGWLFRHRLY